MAPTIFLADTWDDVFPFIIMFGLFILVPLIAIMASHQRKMAEIIHRNRDGQSNTDEVIARLDQMQREMSDLRQRQNETILALEDRRREADVRERVSE